MKFETMERIAKSFALAQILVTCVIFGLVVWGVLLAIENGPLVWSVILQGIRDIGEAARGE